MRRPACPRRSASLSGERRGRGPLSRERGRKGRSPRRSEPAAEPILFGKRRLGASLVDIGALGASLAASIAAARRVDRPAAALVAPYLGWVCFAGLLNAELGRRNR
ncbi:MAG: tryptophan-rich sensory protein [Myxococcaceae bacterium]|nr:tryptophan-rich sensory protein [Myxococcaceae bacterium]